jgi:phage tail-like protein
MARLRIEDYLQSYRFFLMETSYFSTKLNWTKRDWLPLFIIIGVFSSVSAPFISVEIEDIQEGNMRFPRKWPGKVSFGSITLERGILFWDADFWRWMVAGSQGQIHRKTLALFALSDIGFGKDVSRIKGLKWGANILSAFGLGGAIRIPMKAWALYDCLPVEYHVASDFDAKNSEISIASLEVQPEVIEEWALTA